MEMRKIKQSNPNPNPPRDPSKTRHSSSVSFDSFLFVDNVTNSRIVLKDARRHYEKVKQPSRHKLEEEKDVNTLNECLSTLKSTKLFQMDSLRSKIFKSTHVAKSNSTNTLQETKRGLRTLIESSINQLSMQELRQCFADPNHRIEPRIIALQSLAGHQLTKENIESLLSDKAAVPNETSKLHKMDRNHMTEDLSAFEMKEEKQLLEQANNYLQNNLKSNSSHLIKPKYHKELYEKLYSACQGKKIPKKIASKLKSSKLTDCDGIFQPIKRGEIANQIERKLAKKDNRTGQPKQRKEIVFAVENNLFFDLEILIMMDRQLVHAQDPQGNNLLHIAAKNRNDELFSFLLKKAGGQALAAKNNLGRTPLDLARLYGANLIVKICENYSPYSYS